jgi:hypothetical protein
MNSRCPAATFPQDARMHRKSASPLQGKEKPYSRAPRHIGEGPCERCVGYMATVTAELRFLGNHYYNLLSLLRCDEGWLITHKLFGATTQCNLCRSGFSRDRP